MTIPISPRKRAAAIVAAVALGLTVFVAGPLPATASGIGSGETASDITYPVPEGVYLSNPWASPGEEVWVGFVGSTSECGDGATGVSLSWSFVGADGTTALTINGAGGDEWGIGYTVVLPANLPQGAGNLVVTCSLYGDESPASISMPLLISASAPASNYNSATAWTSSFDGPIAGATVTVSALGFKAGESVTITFVNETMVNNNNGDFTGAFAPAAVVTADGEGAVTADVVVPSGWASDDVVEIVAAGATSHYLLRSGTGEQTNGEPSIGLDPIGLVSPTGGSFPGSALGIDVAGYKAGAIVSIGLHSAAARAVQFATLTANSNGRVSGVVYLPESVAPGSYRVWAGAKTLDYLLLNAPIVIVAKPSKEPPAAAPATSTAELTTLINGGTIPNVTTTTSSFVPSLQTVGNPLDNLDVSKPFSGALPWANTADSFVDVYAYSSPVPVGTFPVIKGKVQLTDVDLSTLQGGGHHLVFQGQTSRAISVMAINVAIHLPVVSG